MTSRHQVNAKTLERRVCRALGGERNGPNPGSDCVGVPYSVEVKRMVRPGLRQSHLEQARRQSLKEGKPWLLVVGGHNDPEPIVFMEFRTFVNALIDAGEVPLTLTDSQLAKLDGNIDKSGECWEWTGYKDSSGYGRIEFNRKRWAAHRVTYMIYTGDAIPFGLEVDHLCRNKGCVNPSHLEAVTKSENIRRGDLWQYKVTECPAGHPYDAENTYHYNGKRSCRTCRTEASRRHKETLESSE